MKGNREEFLAVEINVVELPEEVSTAEPNQENVILTEAPEAPEVPVPEWLKEKTHEAKPIPSEERPKIRKKKPTPTPQQDPEHGKASPAQLSEILKQVKPRYPPAALRAGHQGTVSLLLRIGLEGRTKEIRVLKSSGREDCDRAAIEAIQRWWRFRPLGYEYDRTLDVHFKLD
ncbi:MAG: TonB family protein [Methylacidiphilales bacterium]|nr:TonB family protein [Candidatus Methylacidiphilales bacterium]MDW8349138.1 TonB family protein [Verrucomicrobiae bacterium]